VKPVSKFVSGHVALDFCNTAGEHLADSFDEMLIDWETFVRWCVQAGIVAETSYASLARKRIPIQPVIRLRECIYRAGLALARQESIPAGDLAEMVRTAKGDLPIVHAGPGGLHWQPKAEQCSEQLRALLAREALSLFCSPRAARIGICEGGACGWLFVDESRGKRRRWCDMKDCGSRAKARSFYERHKDAGDKSSH
jgi:predicted RNA-binding Zn ribbon-like protein